MRKSSPCNKSKVLIGATAILALLALGIMANFTGNEKTITHGEGISKMKLTICDQEPINNPSNEVIIDSLNSLDMATGNAFVILAVNDMTYMQVSGDKNIGFDLEYQEGNIKNHFRAKQVGIPVSEIEQAFIAYLNENPTWKSQFEFERISW